MKVVIIGAGGHGRVVAEILRAVGRDEPVGFVDSSPQYQQTKIAGLPVFGGAQTLPALRRQNIAAAIVAIGDCRSRRRYAQILKEHGFGLITAIHPSASISPTATLGSNIVVAAQSAICAGARLGDSVIVNTGATVDHDCEIDEAVHICPGVHLAGRVRAGTCAWLGIGSTVIQSRSIGPYAIVGAGAVVIHDVPANATVVGIPAKVIKIVAPPATEPEIH